MIGLFWSSYSFVFYSSNDFAMLFVTTIGTVINSTQLLMVMLPAAAANQVGIQARNIVISLPGWFPKQYEKLNIHVRQNFTQEDFLTLWKIYKNDKSLLISALGTLLTYGFLVGTLGSIEFPK
ncbi:uncharacterized protein NPIL_164531 [Nephila pilipes]|uniref:Uncharacterized protein n=1 Tax=Nephila pilipes TaxID=299642 RepID=A0A8X6UDE2_NEPPI|nr:uncharacterized protein NPIL_164531 [Nephila pilipes]